MTVEKFKVKNQRNLMTTRSGLIDKNHGVHITKNIDLLKDLKKTLKREIKIDHCGTVSIPVTSIIV